MLSERQIFEKSYDPWEHAIVDSFYNQELFVKMQVELLRAFPSKTQKTNLCIMDDLSEFPDTQKCIASNPIIESHLSHFEKYREYEHLVIRNQVIFCNGKVDYRIHDEKESKILSAVTYVAPKKATGTRLYHQNQSFAKEVDWVPNRMMMFCGQIGKTWHSYHSEENAIRITVNTFLEKE